MEQVEINQNGAWFLVMYLFNIDTLIHPSIFNTHFSRAQGQGCLLCAIKKSASPSFTKVMYLCQQRCLLV